MTKKVKYLEKNLIYFCTFTCFNWLPLFKITNFYDAIYDWFDLMKSQSNLVVGYVIMPNHLHLLLYVSPNSKTINEIIGTAKRFMAYKIVSRLKEKNEMKTLDKLNNGVTDSARKKGANHQVFIPSFDCKPCVRGGFILQKVNYMHNNPLSGKWKLVESPIEYEHSSAKFYSTGEQGRYPVVHYHEIAYENDEVGGIF